MKLIEVDKTKLAPMMLHYVELKEKYLDTIIFYRLGDFYEMFFEDAEIVSHELELTLTGRNAGLEERVPMCGVPYHSVDIYIDKLIKKGYKVAICEQLEDAKNTKGMVKRDITEVISSGSVVAVNSLNEKENNYIASIYNHKYCYTLTYMDITTGEIYLEVIPSENDLLINKVLYLGIKEVIVNEDVSVNIVNSLKSVYKMTVTVTNEIYQEDNYVDVYQNVNDEKQVIGIKHLINYVIYNLRRKIDHIQRVIVRKNNEYLRMDIHTKRNLELTESIRNKERMYSLLWLIDETKTAMGSRKLKAWIEAPLVDIDEINKRYEIVEKLLEEFIMTDDLRKYLYEIYDLERLCGRVALGTANGRDLIQLRNSLRVLPEVNKIFKEINYEELEDVSELYKLLENSLYETPPVTLKEGYLIKEGFSKELDELKDLRSGGKDFISNYEQEEREKTGIKNLKVGFNKVFGYFIEISKGNLPLVKEEYGYIRKQTLTNCERFINPILKEKEDLVLSAEEKIINLEYDLFNEIRNKCNEYTHVLQGIAKKISEIDVLSAFALVAEKYRYVRPILNNENKLKIVDGRHPVVEKVIKGEYVPNDVIMDTKTAILLITGPNMAGKSTYMRQLGIISIMAQIGCYVPAKEAVLPVFDKIFTRIGASDDLVSGESTFMVEMMEAANAIKNATGNSLILFDELGRGTATFDGMSLAQAILEYINNRIGCKTLFSTHYHELTDLEISLDKLVNKHVSASENDGKITFLHKVKDGSVDKSYGINVAKLANLPEEVTSRAEEILKVYETKERKRDMAIQTSLPLDFGTKPSEIEEELKKLNVLEMTPIEAMNKLYELKNKIKS